MLHIFEQTASDQNPSYRKEARSLHYKHTCRRRNFPLFHMPRDGIKTWAETGREAPCDLAVFTLTFRAPNPTEPPFFVLFYLGLRKNGKDKVLDLPNNALKKLFRVEGSQTWPQSCWNWCLLEGKLFALQHSGIVSPAITCLSRSLKTTLNS